jgi:hypothetical protein
MGLDCSWDFPPIISDGFSIVTSYQVGFFNLQLYTVKVIIQLDIFACHTCESVIVLMFAHKGAYLFLPVNFYEASAHLALY